MHIDDLNNTQYTKINSSILQYGSFWRILKCIHVFNKLNASLLNQSSITSNKYTYAGMHKKLINLIIYENLMEYLWAT